MQNDKHRGWSNYATWRVYAEIFNDWDDKHLDSLTMGDNNNLPQQLKDYVEELLFLNGDCNMFSLAGSFALSFLSNVNWHEIAKQLTEEVEENIDIDLDGGLSAINE